MANWPMIIGGGAVALLLLQKKSAPPPPIQMPASGGPAPTPAITTGPDMVFKDGKYQMDYPSGYLGAIIDGIPAVTDVKSSTPAHYSIQWRDDRGRLNFFDVNALYSPKEAIDKFRAAFETNKAYVGKHITFLGIELNTGPSQPWDAILWNRRVAPATPMNWTGTNEQLVIWAPDQAKALERWKLMDTALWDKLGLSSDLRRDVVPPGFFKSQAYVNLIAQHNHLLQRQGVW